MSAGYHVIRHSDDTGHESVVDYSARATRAAAEQLAADLQRTATMAGAAVTYRAASRPAPPFDPDYDDSGPRTGR